MNACKQSRSRLESCTGDFVSSFSYLHLRPLGDPRGSSSLGPTIQPKANDWSVKSPRPRRNLDPLLYQTQIVIRVKPEPRDTGRSGTPKDVGSIVVHREMETFASFSERSGRSRLRKRVAKIKSENAALTTLMTTSSHWAGLDTHSGSYIKSLNLDLADRRRGKW